MQSSQAGGKVPELWQLIFISRKSQMKKWRSGSDFNFPQAIGFGTKSGVTAYITFVDSNSPSIMPRPLSPEATFIKYLFLGAIRKMRLDTSSASPMVNTRWMEWGKVLLALLASGMTVDIQFAITMASQTSRRAYQQLHSYLPWCY